MPELPEVETVARQMRRATRGQRIKSTSCLDHKLQSATKAIPGNYKIKDVSRLGKQIVFTLARGKRQAFIAIHLRMSGRLLFSRSAQREDTQHLRVAVKLDRGTLYFVDPRRFGTVQVTQSIADLKPKGLEPLAREFTPRRLKSLIGESPQPIKTWLLRQDRLVGIGNIYASEILFDAKIKPTRKVRALAGAEIAQLYRSTRKILTRAIRHSGTTFSDFQDAHGVTGSYQRFLKVYDREGKTCRRCVGTIRKIVQGQRSTFYCGACQD